MAARVSPDKELRVVALYDAGKPKEDIAREIGCSERTVRRLLDRAGRRGPTASEAAAQVAQACRAAVITEVVDEFRATLSPALERHREFLAPGATPDAQQVRVVLWTLERVLPSADAKEQTRAAGASAERYGEVMKALTATDAELTARMQAIEHVQDEVVARRQPYIVNPPDQASA